MESTMQEAERGLKKLDESTEDLTAKQYEYGRQREQKLLILNNLNDKLKAERQCLANSKEALENARKHLQINEDTLERQRRRENTAATVTRVGIGVTIIPIVGWVAGPAMAIGGLLELDEAEKAIKVAKEEVGRSESQVNTYSAKVSDYQSQIPKSELDINQRDEELRRIREKLSNVQLQRVALAEFQKKMRKVAHLLGLLSGRANVLEVQTRTFISLEPVMRVMVELVKLAVDIPRNQILSDRNVMSLVDAMRENNNRLLALCASMSQSSELQNYF
ncbi:hypothetical protein ACEWY4_011795 [Coilia grayii]|uniref:Uncharacterized protein n=1 Tax=Coilia grayii TaxID=363190 RepID=A0ABD1JYM6_9TELE